ncbi:type II toxin-antitoxin system RelE/ParE family toxin [Pelatocladus sp. BLCC-F211]|jgi:phage-related protein|uniref:type II toxin-antitoxin system RelE/ParE family toxin n=1 Tax=Pelatocladus sp. BLCC-F211 TaxID=3342752 RepID=UPI0035BB3931
MTDKRIPARFYQNENGKEPVRDWLKDLDQEERRLIGTDIKTVEFGWPIGMPTCRPMGDGLFEVRTDLPQNRIARVLFCIYEEEMILLHGFIKKSQKTPKKELELALDRKRKLEAGG